MPGGAEREDSKVTGRTSAALLAAVLLPVPIVAVLLLHGLAPLATLASQQGNPPVPELSWEERLQRPTWRQPCSLSKDCEPPLVCFFDRQVLGLYCTDSECMSDSQCREGSVCRRAETLNGEIIKKCTMEGNRREGESCEPFSRKYANACAAGLLCNTWCGRPCEPDEPRSCPEGFFCPLKAGPQGSSCLPTCESHGCPSGQECIRFRDGVSVCSVVRGTNCQRASCPEAQSCETGTLPRRPGLVWMRCESPCSADGPSCPEGFVCHLGSCLRTCEPGVEGACGPDEKCARPRGVEHPACVFDMGG